MPPGVHLQDAGLGQFGRAHGSGSRVSRVRVGAGGHAVPRAFGRRTIGVRRWEVGAARVGGGPGRVAAARRTGRSQPEVRGASAPSMRNSIVASDHPGIQRKPKDRRAPSMPSDLRVRRRDGLAAAREVDDLVVAEQVRAVVRTISRIGEGDLADLGVGRSVAAHLDEVPQGPGVGRDEDLRLGRVGQDRPRGLAGLLPPQRPVLDRRELGRSGRRPAPGRRPGSCSMASSQIRAARGRRRSASGSTNDAVRLVDEPLAELRIPESGPVPDQFVRERPADARR